MTRAGDVRLSDDDLEKRKDLADKKARDLAQLRADMNETFASPAGVRALRWIMGQCCYQNYLGSVNPQTTELLTKNLEYNIGRHSLYISIRNFLRRDVLVAVENGSAETEVDIFS